MKKRILSLFMAATMLLSLLPIGAIPAFAAGETIANVLATASDGFSGWDCGGYNTVSVIGGKLGFRYLSNADEYDTTTVLTADGNNWKLIETGRTITFTMLNSKLAGITYEGTGDYDKYDGTYVSEATLWENINGKTYVLPEKYCTLTVTGTSMNDGKFVFEISDGEYKNRSPIEFNFSSNYKRIGNVIINEYVESNSFTFSADYSALTVKGATQDTAIGGEYTLSQPSHTVEVSNLVYFRNPNPNVPLVDICFKVNGNVGNTNLVFEVAAYSKTTGEAYFTVGDISTDLGASFTEVTKKAYNAAGSTQDVSLIWRFQKNNPDLEWSDDIVIEVTGRVEGDPLPITLGEVKSHDPWDEKIDVEYTLAGLEAGVDYKVAFDVTAGGQTMSFTSDAAKLTNGTKTTVIDTTKLFGKEIFDPKAKVAVRLIKMDTAELSGETTIGRGGPKEFVLGVEEKKDDSVSVTATTWIYDDDYFDVYLYSEDTTYIFELAEATGGLTYGKTYTYADMVPDWTCTLTDMGFADIKATDATLKVTKDDSGLIHVVATMVLAGVTYSITYDEPAFVPSGTEFTIDGTITTSQYNSYYGVYVYNATTTYNDKPCTLQLALDSENGIGTFGSDKVKLDYCMLYSDDFSVYVEFFKAAFDFVATQDEFGNLSVTGSLYEANGDKYIFNLTKTVSPKTLPYSFDFETDPFSEANGWTNIDADGDGHDWKTGTADWASDRMGIDNSGCAVSESYSSTDGIYNANNWLFSPAVTIPASGATVSWYDCGSGDLYTVYVSETNKSTDPSGMSVICAKHGAMYPWSQRTAELSAEEYGGKTVYIAFQHQDADNFIMMIDNFAVKAIETPAHTHGEGDDAITFDKAWKDATKLPTEAGNYYLDTDVMLDATWNVPAGTTNLCLNGHVIKLTDGKTGSVISVPDGATLNLYDCGTTEHKGYIDAAGLWHLDENGTHSLQSGETVKNIIGGIITSGANTSSNYGGGMNIYGNFTMNGGSIVGNKANYYGGGVYFSGGNSFTMNGGSIVGNISDYIGGGIMTAKNRTITFGGTAVIKDNIADGITNNVYLLNNVTVTLDTGSNPPATGFAVGITTQTAPTDGAPVKFTTNGTADDAKWFTPDNAYYVVKFNTDHLELALHPHTPVKVNGQAATEEAPGWSDYYECSCGECFEDAEGLIPIENLDDWKAQGGSGYIPSGKEIKAARETAKEWFENPLNSLCLGYYSSDLVEAAISGLDNITRVEDIEQYKADYISTLIEAREEAFEKNSYSAMKTEIEELCEALGFDNEKTAGILADFDEFISGEYNNETRAEAIDAIAEKYGNAQNYAEKEKAVRELYFSMLLFVNSNWIGESPSKDPDDINKALIRSMILFDDNDKIADAIESENLDAELMALLEYYPDYANVYTKAAGFEDNTAFDTIYAALRNAVKASAELTKAKKAATEAIVNALPEYATDEAKAIAEQAAKDIEAAETVGEVEEIKSAAINEIQAVMADVCPHCGKVHKNIFYTIYCYLIRIFRWIVSNVKMFIAKIKG